MRSKTAILWVTAFLCVAQIVTPGCSRLIEHPKKSVSVPAIVGGTIGGIAGIPLIVVALPVTLPAGQYLKSRDLREAREALERGEQPGPVYALAYDLMPLAAPAPLAYVGSTVVGGPFWLVFGWWGLPRDASPAFRSPAVFLPWPETQPTPSGPRLYVPTPSPTATPGEPTS